MKKLKSMSGSLWNILTGYVPKLPLAIVEHFVNFLSGIKDKVRERVNPTHSVEDMTKSKQEIAIILCIASISATTSHLYTIHSIIATYTKSIMDTQTALSEIRNADDDIATTLDIFDNYLRDTAKLLLSDLPTSFIIDMLP